MSRDARAIPYPTSAELSAKDHLRLHSRYVVNATTGCWDWTGTVGRGGYAVISFHGRYYQAHRLLHDLTFGPTPADFDVDHRCRNRSCVNPDHTESVPHGENVRRAFDPSFNPALAWPTLAWRSAGFTERVA